MDRNFLPIAGVSPFHRKPLTAHCKRLDLPSVQRAEALRVASTIFASSLTTGESATDASMNTTVGFPVIFGWCRGRKERSSGFPRKNTLEGYRRLTFMMLDADVEV